MRRTRKLCATMIDTVGRELLVVRESKLDENGWPRLSGGVRVKANDMVMEGTPSRRMVFKPLCSF